MVSFSLTAPNRMRMRKLRESKSRGSLFLAAAIVLHAGCAAGQQPGTGTPPTVKVYESPDTPAAGKAESSQPVQVIQTPLPDTKALRSRKTSGALKVVPGDWVDAGIILIPGDTVSLNATGTVTFSDGRAASPDGVDRGWKDLLRTFPLNTANSGALIGRIGQTGAPPFVIGAAKSLQVAAPGNLFLRVNLSSDLSGTGEYQAKVSIKPGAPAQTQSAPPDVTNLISPALFSDIPQRVEDEQHNPGDMVNFALVGTAEQVKSAFASAGWVSVDKTVQDAVIGGLVATLAQKAYTAMPMSTLYLFGRPQDLSYAHADPIAVAAIRHHLRVWKTGKTVGGSPLWVGSATYDNGFEKDQRNGKLTHSIDPNIDKERDFLEQTFRAAGMTDWAAYVTPANPLTAAKTATGGSFYSDGRIAAISLK